MFIYIQTQQIFFLQGKANFFFFNGRKCSLWLTVPEEDSIIIRLHNNEERCGRRKPGQEAKKTHLPL